MRCLSALLEHMCRHVSAGATHLGELVGGEGLPTGDSREALDIAGVQRESKRLAWPPLLETVPGRDAVLDVEAAVPELGIEFVRPFPEQVQ